MSLLMSSFNCIYYYLAGSPLRTFRQNATSTYSQDITTNLLNSLHVVKTGSAATPIGNVTMNVTATPDTADENVTKTVSKPSSSASIAAEKTAAKQPGFKGILAMTVLWSSG